MQNIKDKWKLMKVNRINCNINIEFLLSVPYINIQELL